MGFYPNGAEASSSINGSPNGQKFYILAGNKFGVATDGTIYATNAEIAVNLSAATGTIGGWSIDDNRLYATYSGYVMSLGNGGNEFLSFKDSNGKTIFSVSNTGVVTCKDINIYGENSSSSIYGGLNLNSIADTGINGYIGEYIFYSDLNFTYGYTIECGTYMGQIQYGSYNFPIYQN